MRTRFLRGDTTQNNGLTLPAGEIAIDTEKHAVRLHDGATPGGFEIIGQKAYEGPTSGDLNAGFYGELGPNDFLTYGSSPQQSVCQQGRCNTTPSPHG